MITLEIPSKKQFLYFPEHLGECDAKQYADMAKLIYMFQSQQITYEDFKAHSVYKLLNLKFTRKNTEEKGETIFRLGELVDSFFEKEIVEEKIQLKVKQHYVNNHLPKIKAGFFQTFYGPEDVFEDVEFGQYVDGLEEFINFSQTGELIFLKQLFAIFYLKKNEVYNPKISRKRAKTTFATTDIRHLYGFYLYFSAMQIFIMGGEIYVQGNNIDLSIIYEGGETSQSTIPGIGMQGLLNDIAESGVFGNYQSTRRANIWAILKRLYQIQKKQLEEKQNESTTT